MPEPSKIARAAHNILTRTFNLRRDQNLLILVDPQSLDIVEVMARAARELGIGTTALFVPRALQAELDPREDLPLPAEGAIREADAILSCLSDRPEHLNYRIRVLHASWSRRAKLSHAPGLTPDLLHLVDIDYDAVAEQARQLALALLLGKRLEIVTVDAHRQEHRLTARIGGWNRPPGINDGILRDGSWGTLPPGEVTIAPDSAEGRVVINGSLPGRVLSLGEELILTFHNGRLAEIKPDCPAARHLRETQIAYAQRHGEDNWSNLAEIGFGLNPAVQELTGFGVVDGKKAHTLHIALGHSTGLSDSVETALHWDLVARKPTAYINGRLVLKRGDWRLNETDWNLDHRTAVMPAGWWEALSHFSRSGARTEREGGRLACVWNAGCGRWDSTAVGTEQTARLAARVYPLLPENGRAIAKDELVAEAAQAGVPASTLPGIFWVLQQFDVVRSLTAREAALLAPSPTSWLPREEALQGSEALARRTPAGSQAGRRPIGPV